jgi:hypothetical protein
LLVSAWRLMADDDVRHPITAGLAGLPDGSPS